MSTNTTMVAIEEQFALVADAAQALSEPCTDAQTGIESVKRTLAAMKSMAEEVHARYATVVALMENLNVGLAVNLGEGFSPAAA